jgi:hypothetical protein
MSETFTDEQIDITQKLKATRGYIRHQTFDGFYLMERDSATGKEWVIYDDNLNIVQTLPHENFSYDQAVNRVRDYQASGYESAPKDTGVPGEGALAPEIKYEDYSKYLDTEGKITDRWGFAQYLKGIPGMRNRQVSDIYNLLEGDLPSGIVTKTKDIAEAQKGYGAKRGTIYQSMIDERKKEESLMARGMFTPGQSISDIGNVPISDKYYSALGDVQSQKQDPYGLSEQALYDWIAELPS